MDFANRSWSSDQEAILPMVTEIVDYLLVFQAQYISHLSELLPRLAIIHGTRLFRADYSLILFLSPSLTHVNLGRLVSIRRGTVLFSRLYHVCYVNTIDWSRIIRNATASSLQASGAFESTTGLIKTNLINRNCMGQVCLHRAKHCWMDRVPQIECSSTCVNGCNLDMPQQCCSDPKCLYCINSTKYIIHFLKSLNNLYVERSRKLSFYEREINKNKFLLE